MNDPRKGADAEPTTSATRTFRKARRRRGRRGISLGGSQVRPDERPDVRWHPSPVEALHHRAVRRAQRNRVLDIAGGTGDLTRQFSRLVGPTGEVVLADINASMLKVGRDKLLDKGVSGNVSFVRRTPKLPFPDNHFDCVTIAFGLRNVTPRTKRSAPCCACSSPVAACWCWSSQAEQQPAVQGLRRLFVQPAAADGQAGHQRLRAIATWPSRSACTPTRKP